MLKSQVFEVLFACMTVVNGFFVFNKDLIHHLMDEQELQYYFGTESKFHVPLYEVVKIEVRGKSLNQNQVLHLNLKAFDDEIFLKLKINTNLVSPFMRFVEKSNDTGERELHSRSNECHYLHIDDQSSAAISGCDSKDYVRRLNLNFITDNILLIRFLEWHYFTSQ